ncbi:MAG: pentapeptide repeat-containing protein, partial [Deltaproteobacteria bacterium]
GTNLEWADLRGSDLDGADFTDANLRGAFLGGARICNTTMPDGRIKFTGCSKRPFLEEDTTE